jgi:hypothetical protein
MEKPDLRDPKNWIPRELFAAYVGENSDDMLAYYDKAAAKKNPMLMSFNLLAVLLLPAWLGLRSLWTMWATYTGLIGILPFIEHALGINFPAGAFVGIGVTMGFMARGLLLASANGRYLKLKRQGLTQGAIREALRDRARLNIPFAVAGGVGCAMVILGLAHLASIVSGQPFP